MDSSGYHVNNMSRYDAYNIITIIAVKGLHASLHNVYPTALTIFND